MTVGIHVAFIVFCRGQRGRKRGTSSSGTFITPCARTCGRWGQSHRYLTAVQVCSTARSDDEETRTNANGYGRPSDRRCGARLDHDAGECGDDPNVSATSLKMTGAESEKTSADDPPPSPLRIVT